MSFQETKNASSQILSQYTDTFESLSKQRQAFQIHPVPIEGLKALKRTVKEWSKQALEKCEIASSGTDIFALDQFCNITAICETILLSAVTDPNIQFFLCEDAEGNIQAMGSVAPDANDPSLLHLVDLMTHPHNIRADVNQQESHRAQGAGSALLAYMEDWGSLQGKTRLLLSPFTEARDFYSKAGYRERGFQMIKTLTKTAQAADSALKNAA